jgi:15-cis-phytoene synthase
LARLCWRSTDRFQLFRPCQAINSALSLIHENEWSSRVNVQTIPKRDLDWAYEEARQFLRRFDKDRYAACLFAPPAKRKHLFALYAFSAEIARVRDIVSDPLPGEIRHQWWRDLLEGEVRGDAGANPLAAALLRTIQEHHLPIKPLVDLIEARAFDLYDDPMPTWLDLEGYCGETSSSLIMLAAMILAPTAKPTYAEAAGHAGVTFAITGLLRSFPWHAARGQIYIPVELIKEKGLTQADLFNGQASPLLKDVLSAMRDRARHHLAQTRAHIGDVRAEIAPAFLHMALCEPYLERMDEIDYDPFRSIVELGELKRMYVMWRQNRLARKAG